MANAFVTAEQVAELALQLARADGLLPYVGRTAGQLFKPGVGAQVQIRKPAVLQARTREVGSTAEITADAVSEQYETIALTEQAYSAVDLTDADMTLEIADFGAQVLAPQALAVAMRASELAVAELEKLPAAEDIAYDEADPVRTFTAARKAMRALCVPAASVQAVVGLDLYEDLLNSGAVDREGERGDTVRSLRGLSVVESNLIPANTAYVFVRDAVQLVSVAPQPPKGAGHAATATEDGLTMTSILDYDARTLQDRSVLSVFLGAKILKARRADNGELITPALRIVAG